MSQTLSPESQHAWSSETRDGHGAGDHDSPYEFDRRPHEYAPFLFGLRGYARLLVLRGRVQEGLVGSDDIAAARLQLRWPPRDATSVTPWFRCADCGGPAPLATQLGQPSRCSSCEQTRFQHEIVEAILYTAGVAELLARRPDSAAGL